MVEIIKNKRIRVNFDVSTKGVVSPSITVEMEDEPYQIVLDEATRVLDEALLIAKARNGGFNELSK